MREETTNIETQLYHKTTKECMELINTYLNWITTYPTINITDTYFPIYVH